MKWAMTNQTEARSIQIVRWIARLLPIPLVLFVVVMNLAPDPLTGELSRTVTIPQVVLALCFPGLYVVGWLVAWRREIAGGALMVLGIALFIATIALVHGADRITLSLLVIGLIIAVPGVLFLWTGYRSRRR
jgi:hypothetical protein